MHSFVSDCFDNHAVLVTNNCKGFVQVYCFSWWTAAVISLSAWTFSGQGFYRSTLCSPAINPNGALLDKEQEYSSQWILAVDSGTAACVRACGFGPSRDIWRNAGITQSPFACWAQPHIVSGCLKTTLKWSGSAKCGLFDGTFTDFYTGWSHITLQLSINQKQFCSAFFNTDVGPKANLTTSAPVVPKQWKMKLKRQLLLQMI